jgi:hypothetical protein
MQLMKNLKNAVVCKGVPISVAFTCCFMGTPWYLALLVLGSAVYWYGPVVVYLTLRMPTLFSLRALDSAATLPSAHTLFLGKLLPLLQGVGFVERGRLATADQQGPITGTVVLLQHERTSDLAHLLIVTKDRQAEAAEMLAFSRARTNGSRILTVRNSVPSPFPPNPIDLVLSVGGSIDPLALWQVHRARVAADAMVKPNETVTDAFRFQMELEREGVRKHIDSGLWQQGGRPEFLRPTARGALLMCLRMLAPWKQMACIRARMQVRRLLRESRG